MSSPTLQTTPWGTDYDSHRHSGSICSVCSSTIVKPVQPAKQQGRPSVVWQRTRHLFSTLYKTLNWTPPICRWDPEAPPRFTPYLNLVFAWATAVSAANLYYTHPMLDVLAREFRVGEDDIAQVPTVIQAGYAIGLFTLCPLGDVFKRRPLVLRLCLASTMLWIVLCTTSNLRVFTGVGFICAFLTVTPQLMFPLVGDLAPPARRAAALSIVTSGLMLGQFLARFTAGIISSYATWRAVFWLGFGFQISSLVLLYLHMPDYPSTNPTGLTYLQNLTSMIRFLYTRPVLAQACATSFFTASTFSNFWTTLTLLLSGPRYNYPNLYIGLFALVILVPIALGPLFAHHVIDHHVPLPSIILSQLIVLIAVLIGTFTGPLHPTGLVLQAMLGDFGNQMSQTACRSNIYTIDARAKNRVNTALMMFVFAGQMTGTAAGSALYDRFGWGGSGGYSVAAILVALMICAGRGPWEEGWAGWRGGWSVRKKDAATADGKTVEKAVFGSWTEGAEDAEEEGRGNVPMPSRGVGSRRRSGGIVPAYGLSAAGPRTSRWREEGMVDVPMAGEASAEQEERSDEESESDDLRKEKDEEESDDEGEVQGEACVDRRVSDGSRHTRFFSIRSGSMRSQQTGR
ncbi:hypothetical protein CAC42_4280 [Sphaceloma murrayae]|uniref:Major facilitator superfamily (MFS) profile domain-containing protein n=1 Tax=Sphaceloma murrayae TaxID=2082308 RepID=A0A2K1QKY7_9PEZI|nr:hypothetical protein CAC42_4280 [Sphaceloma murrayae]